jgi:hypothetical protein
MAHSLLPPPTLHNRIYPIHLATSSDKSPCGQASASQDSMLQDHERLDHISFKRVRRLNIDGSTPPTSKRLKPITCPVCIASKTRRSNRPAPSTPADRPTELWQDVYTDLSGKSEQQALLKRNTLQFLSIATQDPSMSNS